MMKKTNYSMVVINRKYDENDKLLLRRVLISYTKKNKLKDRVVYKGTKIIEVDDYFLNQSSSHQYIFTDEGYNLINVDESRSEFSDFYINCINNSLKEKVRPYHYLPQIEMFRPIEFSCEREEDARLLFSLRQKEQL